MTLTVEQVKKVAHLARLKLSEEDTKKAHTELTGILHWINCLQEIDTNGVENYTDLEHNNLPHRDDEVCDGNYVEKILSNAPESAHNLFCVPKVVE